MARVSRLAFPMSLDSSSLRKRARSEADPGELRNSTRAPSSRSVMPRPSHATRSFCKVSSRRSLGISRKMLSSVFPIDSALAKSMASIFASSERSFIGGCRYRIGLQRYIAEIFVLCCSDYTLLHELEERQETHDNIGFLC